MRATCLKVEKTKFFEVLNYQNILLRPVQMVNVWDKLTLKEVFFGGDEMNFLDQIGWVHQ